MPSQTTQPSNLSPLFPTIQPSPDPASSSSQPFPDPAPSSSQPSLDPSPPFTKPTPPTNSSKTRPGEPSESTIALPADPSKSDIDLPADPRELATPIPSQGGLGGLLQLSDPSAPLPPPLTPSPSPPPPFPSSPPHQSPSSPNQPSRRPPASPPPPGRTQPPPALNPPPGPLVSNGSSSNSSNTPFLYPPAHPFVSTSPPLPTDPIIASPPPSAAFSAPLFIGVLVGFSLLLSALLLMLYCFVGDRGERPGARRPWLFRPSPYSQSSAASTSENGVPPSTSTNTAAAPSSSGDAGVGSDGSGSVSLHALSSQAGDCDPEVGGEDRREEGDGGKHKRKGKRWRIVRIGKVGSGESGLGSDAGLGDSSSASGSSRTSSSSGGSVDSSSFPDPSARPPKPKHKSWLSALSGKWGDKGLNSVAADFEAQLRKAIREEGESASMWAMDRSIVSIPSGREFVECTKSGRMVFDMEGTLVEIEEESGGEEEDEGDDKDCEKEVECMDKESGSSPAP
ncbi:hypothetical protein CLOP_g9168 [Closterium sp. NIES-67]|nr:hypothetical protein CLOP_g9168 [Closterium sp. NIES-67]